MPSVAQGCSYIMKADEVSKGDKGGISISDGTVSSNNRFGDHYVSIIV